MPRKPRIHYPGALYHVICRGNNREWIYRSEAEKHEAVGTDPFAARSAKGDTINALMWADKPLLEGNVRTTKTDAKSHGFRLKNIEYLVNRHNGLMKIEPENSVLR